MCLFQVWFPEGICPVVRLLGPMIVLFLVFKEISIVFSLVAVSICISTNSAGGFPFLHTLQHLLFADIFNDGHSDLCEVIPHCSFDLHFSTATAKSLQSCPTLCDPIDGSPPGSPVPGILQARTLEWVAISFSNS